MCIDERVFTKKEKKTSVEGRLKNPTPGTLTGGHSERPRKDHRSRRPPRRQPLPDLSPLHEESAWGLPGSTIEEPGEHSCLRTPPREFGSA